MSEQHVKYLLVGGGVASFSAAQTIRRLDADGTVILVGQEANRPYHRQPLSRAFLRRQIDREPLFACSPDWFSQQRIQLRTGVRAAHLDTSRCILTLANGDRITYDRLLLATGVTPKPLDIPGADLPGLFYLRTLWDAEHLHTAIDKAKHEGRPHPSDSAHRGRAAVIGANLMGVEIAASLVQCGIAVDLIVGRSLPWSHMAGEATGRFLAGFLQKRGVRVHLDERAQRLEGDGRVQRVVLSSGQALPCDFAVAAVGVAPGKDLLRNTPLIAEKAILVDETCHTSEPQVWAAGDCAAMRDPLSGKYRSADPWDTAADTGTLAGTYMASTANAPAPRAPQTLPYVQSEIFDLTIQAWGNEKHLDRRLLRGIPHFDQPGFLEFGLSADGRISQVLRVGDVPDSSEALEDLVRRHVRIDGNAEFLKDPAYPLSQIG